MRTTKNPISLQMKPIAPHPPFRKQTPLARRAGMLRRHYGLTHASYATLVNAQWGLCAICFMAPGKAHPLHVDHDHQTGRIRGLLCSRCNTALGGFGESILRLKSAIEYLKDRTNMNKVG